MSRSLPIALLVSAALVAAAPAADAAVYMKVDGIKGQSTRSSDDPHKGEIPIESWSLPAASSASGSGAGKVSYSDLSVVVGLEKARPLGLAAGDTLRNVVLRSDDGEPHAQIELENVLISSYQTSGHGGSVAIGLRGTGKTLAAEVMASPLLMLKCAEGRHD